MSIFKFKTTKGIGLLELMLALAVIALLLIMATRYFSLVSQSRKVDQAVRMTGMVKSAAHRWLLTNDDFSYASSYKSLSYAMEQQGYVPEGFFGKDTSPWGKDFQLDKSTSDVLTLTVGTSSTQACTNLSHKFNGSTKSCTTDDFTWKMSVSS